MGNLRLTRPSKIRKFGVLEIVEEARVVELDDHGPCGDVKDSHTLSFPRSLLDAFLSKMVVVIPCKDEALSVIKGVISAVPASCFVILVSNCSREQDDEYERQVDMVKTLSNNGKHILSVHQKDLRAAASFQASGMPELLDPTNGTIRNGKGEGMLLGIAIAAAFCPQRRYVCFVDADNFNPTSVAEYCTAFAAGFAMSPSPELQHSMVRLKWASKPKIRDGQLEFVTEGRCSRIINSWLNKLFATASQTSSTTDTAPDFITTGNAGEHAMSMDLAIKLRMAAGYAIEPFHFIDLLERGHLVAAGDATPSLKITSKPLNKPVRILQIRTLNPHFHRLSDDDHIRRMWAAGLGSIYHGLAPYSSISQWSSGTVSELRNDMYEFAVKNDGIDESSGDLPLPRIYSALEDLDFEVFKEVLGQSLGLLRAPAAENRD
ncbi:hypothetical protein VTI74DRAFT_11323 [Chaetomium olivicolor]